MDFYFIKEKLVKRIPRPEGHYQYFSVLVPIVEIDDVLHLLFEVRSEKLKTQPREICFPGGRMELGETAENCAARETSEELNIPLNQIDVCGSLDFLVLPYNLVLYPFLGTIKDFNMDSIDFNKDEVSEIFTVPLNYFIKTPPLSHPIEIQTLTGEDFPYHLLDKGEAYNWKSGKYPVFFYQYKDYVIWGITARIIKNLVDIIQE